MPGTKLDISEARRRFNRLDDMLNQSDTPMITVTRHGQDAFAIVDMAYLNTVLETIEILSDPQEAEVFRQSMADIAADRLHDHDAVKKELG